MVADVPLIATWGKSEPGSPQFQPCSLILTPKGCLPPTPTPSIEPKPQGVPQHSSHFTEAPQQRSSTRGLWQRVPDGRCAQGLALLISHWATGLLLLPSPLLSWEGTETAVFICGGGGVTGSPSCPDQARLFSPGSGER